MTSFDLLGKNAFINTSIKPSYAIYQEKEEVNDHFDV